MPEKLGEEETPDILEACLDKDVDNLWDSLSDRKDRVSELPNAPPAIEETLRDRNDRVSESRIRNVKSSLCFIKTEKLRFEPNIWDAKKIRAVFDFKGILYNLALTDLNFHYSKNQVEEPAEFDRMYSACLCISLGTNYESYYYYKLVAAVINLKEKKL